MIRRRRYRRTVLRETEIDLCAKIEALEGKRSLAHRRSRDGDPEPFHIEENETTFTIDWKGSYRIEGAAFVYRDRETGRLATIYGYPTNKLIQMR